MLKPLADGRIQMRQVAVAESVKGRGIGRMMARCAADLARGLGYEEMLLHARERAVPFYEPLGYAKVGDPFSEVTIPHWIMMRAL